jgi:membrane-associated HD superfamily phosphohydrolase
MRMDIGEIMKPDIAKDIEYTVNWHLYAGFGMIVIGGVVLILGVNKKMKKKSRTSLNEHAR